MLSDLKARVYLYGYAAEQKEAISRRFAELSIPEPVEIRPNQTDVVLEDILMRGAEGDAVHSWDERLVLFAGISDRGVQSLMQVVKALDVPRPIFAVVTKHSIRWRFRELMDHLIAEKRSYSG
jgi:hypothetical protein